MTTAIATYTPWGWTRDIKELAEGVWRVSTASHGGLKLSRERWDELPAAVQDAMLTATFAEEDCEEPIVRTLLGLGNDRDREMALMVAGYITSTATVPRSPSFAAIRSAFTTTSFPIWERTGLTPSSSSTPAWRRSPSPMTRTWWASTDGWRSSSAGGATTGRR